MIFNKGLITKVFLGLGEAKWSWGGLVVVMGGHGVVRGRQNDLGLQLLIMILLLKAILKSFLLCVVLKLNKHYL